jgi:Flp pilus assembly protein TadG
MRFLHRDRGQATVELALLLLPIILVLIFGMIEFGTLLSANMTVSQATREGARVAGSLANGGGALGCGAGQSPNWSSVDPQVIAAVERALTATGALVTLSDVQEIRIFKATSTGAETAGKVNTWTYSLGGGPSVDGRNLDFVEGTVGWTACSRDNVIPADSVGVTVRYVYRARTPLRFLLPGLASLAISDRTVMTLNATR